MTGNTDIKNYARLLLANEQQAAKVYWHLYPAADANARDQPYPEQGLSLSPGFQCCTESVPKAYAILSQLEMSRIGSLVPGCEFNGQIPLSNLTISFRFWGAQRVQIAAIQILPVTPVNEVGYLHARFVFSLTLSQYMYDTEWVRNVYSYTQGELTSPDYGDEWKVGPNGLTQPSRPHELS